MAPALSGLSSTALERPGREHIRLIVLLVALVPASALLTRLAGIEMHFDEAQYWEWSQHLDWSYYSKGPIVAWLIALSESVFGHGEWQTRLPAWLLHSLWLGLVHGLAFEIWGSRRAAWLAVVLAATTPIYLALGLVMTTDIVLFCAWTAGLWAITRAVGSDNPRAWYGAAIAIGLGALGKLSIGLLPLSILPYLLWRHRDLLRSPHPWLASLIVLLIMSPVLVWNLGHDWVMFRHELHHVEGNGRALPLEFVIGQWLSLSPLVAIVGLRALWRRPQRESEWLLLSSAIVVLLFFTIKAISAKVQVNWPAPAYIGLIVLATGPMLELGRIWQRMLRAGIVISLLIVAIAFFPGLAGLDPDKDPLRITRAWRQTIATIHDAVPDVDFIMTHNYQLAAEIAYYWPPPHPPVHILSFGQRRYNQHDLWPGIENEGGHDGLYIATSDHQPPQFATAFTWCSKPRPVTIDDGHGRRIRQLFITRCRNYRASTPWPQPTVY